MEIIIAWTVLIILWLAITYIVGGEPSHIFDESNYGFVRLIRGIYLQLAILAILAIPTAIVWAILLIVGVIQ